MIKTQEDLLAADRPPNHPDVWTLCEENHRRELPAVDSLRTYALAASTREVHVVPPTRADPEIEFRVYGAGEAMVWLSVACPTSKQTSVMLNALCWRLHRERKLLLV